MAKEKVLIVGGGFGGVKAALTLARDEHFEVTLLSNESALKYYPTLYRVATGSTKANASIPLEKIFSGLNIDIKLGSAANMDRQKKLVTAADGKKYPYDQLILVLGVVTNYFNIPGLAEYSYGIKSQEEVKQLKQHLHQQLIDEHRPDLNYVVVGAGPTGIELAGALPAYLSKIMENHGLEAREVHIDLIEAMPRLLPNLPKDLSKSVAKRLKKLGVKLYLNSKVEGETADELTVNGKPIRSHTVIWTAGVTNNPFFKDNGFILMNHGKVAVNVYLQTEPGIYVIGDNANTPYSGSAQTALYDGEFVANNLIRSAQGKTLKSYRAKAPITVIPAGSNWAVVLWRHLYFKGFIGYLLREAANIRGFHDLEPWPEAIKQYLSEFIEQDDCSVCALNSSQN